MPPARELTTEQARTVVRGTEAPNQDQAVMEGLLQLLSGLPGGLCRPSENKLLFDWVPDGWVWYLLRCFTAQRNGKPTLRVEPYWRAITALRDAGRIGDEAESRFRKALGPLQGAPSGRSAVSVYASTLRKPGTLPALMAAIQGLVDSIRPV